MPKYILHYFNAKGVAETARFICAVGNIDFEDRRFEMSEWPGNIKAGMPFGKVPVLNVNGELINQSSAIARFLAKQVGLAGRNELESFKIDALVDTLSEVRDNLDPIFFPPEGEVVVDKEGKLKKYIEETNKTLTKLEAYLKANKGGDGFLVGDKMSWADLHLVAVVEVMAMGYPDALKNFPKMSALNKKVRETPNLANYIAKRPKTEF